MYLDWEAMCALIPDLYIMGCVRASLFVGLTLTRCDPGYAFTFPVVAWLARVGRMCIDPTVCSDSEWRMCV